MRLYRSWVKPEMRAFERLLEARRARFPSGIMQQASRIVEAVRRGGDAALFKATARYDGVRLTRRTVRVDPRRMREAWLRLETDRRSAVRMAWGNILAFHRRQVIRGFVMRSRHGVLSQVVRPLDRVGIHVSAAAAPLVSTLLMCAGAARAAGVREIVLISPPRYSGTIAGEILAGAWVAGIREAYAIGGAQGVAALAYGTESVPSVDKIVGPGNAYAQAAKALTQGGGIEGPSEILVLADGTARPGAIAADLIAQAEHSGDNWVVLVTPSRSLVLGVLGEVRRQLDGFPRSGQAVASLSRFGAIVLVRTMDEGLRVANGFAPEHLAIMARGAPGLARRVTAAGTVLVGGFSPVAAADYAAGPNHVLPTAGSARYNSGLGVKDFMKFMNVSRLTRRGLARLAPSVAALARMEGLEGHARSVEVPRA
jgi:histidinol dehydrogenase